MHKATLRLFSPKADVVYGAISPEIGREIPRTRVQSRFNRNELVLEIQATDLSALRAAINSYLRWMKLAEDVSTTIGESYG
ncbi:MAG: KEOPS complex subunit Pcc1 [Methanomassiliicoccales archaeon]|jgi:KEOPS complex subunit Pcc1|nr:KEOPS complex subunit Pcc1 [Methanomassiliicoccales archaeon]